MNISIELNGVVNAIIFILQAFTYLVLFSLVLIKQPEQ